MRWTRDDVRAFRDRDWSAFERAPVSLDQAQSEALAASLYEQVRRTVVGWPSEADRDADLAAHVRLSECFARIWDAERRRGHPR